jgi:hypothetical protein
LEYSLPFNILFGIALSSIFSTCTNHLILCDLLYLLLSVMCLSLHWTLSSIYYFPSLVRKFCVLIFLSNILSAFSFVSVKVHVSAPYVATGLINVLYTCSLAALDFILLLSVLRFDIRQVHYV